MKPDLTIILPVYNEEKRVRKGIGKCSDFIKASNLKIEIILVNDGSTDKTKQDIKKLIKGKKNIKLISYPENRGKGYAIKRGVGKAKGNLILFTDIDLSTPLTEINKFLSFIDSGADIVIGTRKVKGAKIKKHQKPIREWLGRGFTFLSNLILQVKVSDFTCGFKLFKKKAAKKIFKKTKIKRWGFDAEALFLAEKMNFSIVEVPVIWENDEDTKVDLKKDILGSFADLLKIRWYDIKGEYQ